MGADIFTVASAHFAFKGLRGLLILIVNANNYIRMQRNSKKVVTIAFTLM